MHAIDMRAHGSSSVTHTDNVQTHFSLEEDDKDVGNSGQFNVSSVYLED